jgi:peptidoglycan/xylan/chitin deacetylase (PgdA/CDA1 family)
MRTYSLHQSNEYNNIVVVMIVTTLLLSSSIAFNQVALSSSSSNPATNNYYSYSSPFQDPSLLLKAKNTINGTKSYSNATSNSSKNGINSYIKNSTTNSTTSRVPHSDQLVGGNNTNSIKNDKTGISGKLVILGFDDSLKSQYTLAKPILDKYGFKGTFFTVCNYVGKDNSSNMNWTQIKVLQKEGHDIESHTMNHKQLTKLSNANLEYEVGQSKQCLADHGMNATIFAYPFSAGSDKPKVVDVVAKYYRLARTGGDPIQFLNCVGWNNTKSNSDNGGSADSSGNADSSGDSGPNQFGDCRTYTPDGKLTSANRYSIRALSQQHVNGKHFYNDTQMLQRFVDEVNTAAKYNDKVNNNSTNGTALKAIAVLKYHNFMNGLYDKEYKKDTYATDVNLFAAEMKYLHDNGFRVIKMSDLGFDANRNVLYVRDNS